MWNDLLTTALIGTERRVLNLANLPETFRDLAAQLEGEDTEKTLLALAGAMTLHRRVGQSAPLDTTPLLDPCDLDDLPTCSPRAGLILQQILVMPQQKTHLQEWISLAARQGQRVREEYLPRFLADSQRPTLPDDFYVVIGKRGHWLAQQNEGWAYAVLPRNDTEWETARLPAKRIYLRRLRASDPARARALLESNWSREIAENRPPLLGTFHVNLSQDDEPFLERMLDDRTRVVRSIDTSLLAKLKDSAYSQRMIARRQQFIHLDWQKHLLSKKLVIDVTLPEICDESMIRDGIDPKPSTDSELGKRAYWLLGIAAKQSASFWLSGTWSAADLVQAISEMDDEVKTYLHKALANISECEHHDPLALALLESEQVAVGTRAQILQAVSPKMCEDFLIHALMHEKNSSRRKSIFEVTNLCKFSYTWSESLTRAFLAALPEMLAPHKNVHVTDSITAHMPAYMMFFSPDCVEAFRELANLETTRKPLWTNVVKHNAVTLEFRRDMLKEFAR